MVFMSLRNSAHAKAVLLLGTVAICNDVVGLHPMEETLLSLAAIGCCLIGLWRKRSKAGGSDGVVPAACVPDTSNRPAAAAPKRPGVSASAASLFQQVRQLLGKGSDCD